MSDDRPIGEGDWVTNTPDLLSEPHEVIGITYEGLLVCMEAGGHVVQVSPWDVTKVDHRKDKTNE